MKKTKHKQRGYLQQEIKNNNILEFLKSLQMTQKELAKKCKIGEAHVSRLINNKHRLVSLVVAIKISKALKQPVENIFVLK